MNEQALAIPPGRLIGMAFGSSGAAFIAAFLLALGLALRKGDPLALAFDVAIVTALLLAAVPFVISGLACTIVIILWSGKQLLWFAERLSGKDIDHSGEIGKPVDELPKKQWLLSRSNVNTNAFVFDKDDDGIGNADLKWFVTQAYTQGYAVRDFLGKTFPSGDRIRHGSHPLLLEGYRVLEEAGLLTGRSEGVKGILHETLTEALRRMEL